jgi:hypothetical protein
MKTIHEYKTQFSEVSDRLFVLGDGAINEPVEDTKERKELYKERDHIMNELCLLGDYKYTEYYLLKRER